MTLKRIPIFKETVDIAPISNVSECVLMKIIV